MQSGVFGATFYSAGTQTMGATMDVPAGLTVVTWNAQGSQGLEIDAAAHALAEFAPDLVILQEVQHRQVGALRAVMGARDARWRFKHWPVKVPAKGLGIISKFPLRNVRSHRLAHPWEAWNWRRRIAVRAEIEFGGRVIPFVDVHLGAGVAAAERLRQVGLLLQVAGGASLIAGDLNARPESGELEEFAQHGWRDAERRLHGAVAPPATNWHAGPRVKPPTQRLDYLLVRDRVPVREAFVPEDWKPWALLSDHLPLVARLGL